VADEVGRAQVQPQLRLVVLDRRLVHAAGGGEAADEVDDGAQRRVRIRRRELRSGGRGLAVGKVRGLEHEPLVGGEAFALALVEDRHDDAPAAVEERVRDRGAEAARPAGDERAAGHVDDTLHRGSRGPSATLATVSAMFVRELEAGAQVESVLVVRAAELRAKRDGGRYLRLMLGDRTGSLPANVWDEVAAAAEIATVGTPVRVSGCLQISGRYGAELKLRSVCAAEPGSFDLADLVDGPPRSPAQMEADLRELLATVQDGDLRRLLDAVFGVESPLWVRYRTAPAAKHFHQAYRHGLLEHSLSVAQAVSAISATFSGINRDVAVAGALLHDIGKLDA